MVFASSYRALYERARFLPPCTRARIDNATRTMGYKSRSHVDTFGAQSRVDMHARDIILNCNGFTIITKRNALH